MLIRVWIHNTHPLAGTAASKGSGTLSFDGWLELLRVIPPPTGRDRDSGTRKADGKVGD